MPAFYIPIFKGKARKRDVAKRTLTTAGQSKLTVFLYFLFWAFPPNGGRAIRYIFFIGAKGCPNKKDTTSIPNARPAKPIDLLFVHLKLFTCEKIFNGVFLYNPYYFRAQIFCHIGI